MKDKYESIMEREFHLTVWQKKQATLLYHFSSMSYLEGLRDRVRTLISFAETLVDTSRAEGRDSKLRSRQWGIRNTSENWENNAWSFLADFQRSVAEDLANRRSNMYVVTGANQCARGLAEFSMQWSTPGEEEKFHRIFAELSEYARYLDQTVDRSTRATRWKDFGLTLAWQSHSEQFQAFPKLRALPDLIVESGHLPPRTGVYVSLDDPDATLQFAWTGSPSGRLLDATTFNSTGKAALAAVGRTGLWVEGPAMLRFVLQNLSNPDLKNDPFFDESQSAELAPSLVARNAFTSRPSRWCYVELIKDEFEPIEMETFNAETEILRFEAGETCMKDGFYFSPAGMHSRRYFQRGERFPALSAEYGKTIWQWDGNQS